MKKTIRIYLNAPITIGFVLICLAVLLLDFITNGTTTRLFFCTYQSSLFDPFTYIRLVGHVFGHANLSHFMNNMLYILLLGPILEEKYHKKMINVILITAVVTGVAHVFISPNSALLGASGVVFAFILLASVTGREKGIPMTLILTAILYIGREIYTGVVSQDSISQLTHIIGGISGAVLGMSFKDR
ncbi:MAG: rhomboid family intramembrane serine protease [Erysipelotrichaceae bacterium]|nr:rhomboid family intramembrane serine protease [Erysipelotrichaceae bacterium]